MDRDDHNMFDRIADGPGLALKSRHSHSWHLGLITEGIGFKAQLAVFQSPIPIYNATCV
jgi:hypothetical protein